MTFRSSRGCAAFACATALLLSLPAAPAAITGAEKARFDIPAEDLGKALRDFAVQANCNLSYDPASVKHLQAPAIKGDFTVPDALSIILRGTHLRAVNINENTIQVLDAASAAEANRPTNTAMLRIAYATEPQAPQLPNQNQGAAPTPSSVPTDDNKTPDLEEIIVTGTNITGVVNKTVPILSFDRDAIDRSGYATLADLIIALPQNVKSGNNSLDGVLSGAQFALDNGENSTAANLRGLGASSTLTLLNGHRLAPAAFGTGVDLSMIPLDAVERVDVLTDGSSAVYGSDAVGGVINIILRKDFNGQATTARLDTLSRGGGELKQFGQSIGRTWDSGGALAVLQFDDANSLRADQRTFTENIPQPTDILPTSKRYSGVLSAHQSVAPSLEIFGDALLEHDSGQRNYASGFVNAQEQLTANHTDSTSANIGARWQPFGDWHLEGNGLYSQLSTHVTEIFAPELPGYTNGAPFAHNLTTVKEGNFKLDGTLWSAGGASVKAALGASYRQEAFSSLINYTGVDSTTSRHVHAFFSELYAPLITAANALPGVEKLELSAALRDDHYSDFGTKVNPRVGIFYSPVQQVGLRASYSTSFRAPNPIELLQVAGMKFAFLESGFAQPGDPAGNTPVLLYGNQTLKPESSKNLTAGLDFSPASLPATRFSLNYYRIIYSDRIISSPFSANVFINPQVYGSLITQFPNDAAAQTFVAGLVPPQPLFDFSSGQTGLAGVRYAFPYGELNATKQRTEGLDVGGHSLVNLDDANRLVLDFNATYIKEIDSTFCNTCVGTDNANTYGNPLKLRLRAGAGWSNAAFSVNGAVNFANAYSDINLNPPGRISSFTTADLNASWHSRSTGTTLSINVFNLFNENPPLTAPAFNRVQYDPTNADARGRVLSLQVRQSW
jgi:iron complex outermembrane recepter protein